MSSRRGGTEGHLREEVESYLTQAVITLVGG